MEIRQKYPYILKLFNNMINANKYTKDIEELLETYCRLKFYYYMKSQLKVDLNMFPDYKQQAYDNVKSIENEEIKGDLSRELYNIEFKDLENAVNGV